MARPYGTVGNFSKYNCTSVKKWLNELLLMLTAGGYTNYSKRLFILLFSLRVLISNLCDGVRVGCN